jgi:lysophospholipase L1-like esterase
MVFSAESRTTQIPLIIRRSADRRYERAFRNLIAFALINFYVRRMKRISSLWLPVVAAFAFWVAPASFAQDTNAPVPSTAIINTAIMPAPRDEKWVARHEGFVQEARKGGIDILFLGDSITDGWRNTGSNVWNKYYAPRHAANFGIGGDRTQHVLWRMEKGELDGIKPKVVVLLIGTNNTGKEKDTGKICNTVPETIEGVRTVVKELRAKLPDSKILLLAIFPRGTLDNPQRAQVALINTVIAKLDDGRMVKFLDISPKFLEADGTLSTNIMPDLLHPNEQGYQIWAEAMKSTLDEMLK